MRGAALIENLPVVLIRHAVRVVFVVLSLNACSIRFSFVSALFALRDTILNIYGDGERKLKFAFQNQNGFVILFINYNL